jgi:uncharacterized protein YjbI with pentapeptide repeats
MCGGAYLALTASFYASASYPPSESVLANPDHLARLLSGVQEWNAWRSSGTLVEVDLRGVHLPGADLRGADLWYAKLQGANLAASRLEGAILDRADLGMADLRHANLYRARLRGALFERTALGGASLVEADLTLAKVIETDVDGAIFTGAVVWGANFFGSDVQSAHGLEPGTGWLQDEVGVPRRESNLAVDRRGLMLNGLRRA